MKGFAFLADFRASTASAFSVIVSAMNNLQTNHMGVVSLFLILMPRQKPLQKTLFKAMGIRKSRSFLTFGKVKPPIAPISNLPYVLLYSAIELREHIAEDQLPADFAGSLKYNHNNWISFFEMMDSNMGTIREVERKFPDTEKCLADLRDVELPSDLTSVDDELGRIRSIYEDAIEYLGINEAIDETTHLLGICKAPEKQASFVSLTGNPHWDEYYSVLDSMLQQLFKNRKYLQGLLKIASNRIEYNRQFCEYKKQTGESIKWIRDVGQPALKCPLKLAENLDEAESNRKQFLEQFYRPALEALDSADNCVRKADGLSRAMPTTDVDEPVHFAQDTNQLLESFRKGLEKRRLEYDNLYNFYLNTGRVMRWYKRTLRHLPMQFAPQIVQGDTRFVRFSPQWTQFNHSYALRHPPPNIHQLKAMKNTLDSLPPKPMKHQARLLLHRLELLRRLFDESGPKVTVPEFQEILELKLRSEKGLYDSATKMNSSVSLSSLHLIGQGFSESGVPSTIPRIIESTMGKPYERSSDGSSQERYSKREDKIPTNVEPPRRRGDHVARFLNDHFLPRQQIYSESTDGYSAPAEELVDSRDEIGGHRAQSEHDFNTSALDYVPPIALYRPVSLAAMTGSAGIPVWNSNFRLEERRQNHHMFKELERRKALVAEAEQSLKDSSSYLTEIDYEEIQIPKRRKHRENRGVRGVKNRDAKRPTHHRSEPNLHYEWDDPEDQMHFFPFDEEDHWDDNRERVSDLQSLLNHLHPDATPRMQVLPDTHIGFKPSDIKQPQMRVRRYDRDTLSGDSSNVPSSRYYLTQQSDEIMLF